MNTQDANQRFAKSLFGGSDGDGDQLLDDDEQKQRADAADDDVDDEHAAQKRWVADLFAPDDPDANVLAGLTNGRTVGRTRHDPTPKNA
jgi:hypothetical protein